MKVKDSFMYASEKVETLKKLKQKFMGKITISEFKS